LSNILRIDQLPHHEPLTIAARKIEVKREKADHLAALEQIDDPIKQRQHLQMEIAALKERYGQLHDQMEKEQELARAEIESWRLTQQQEAESHAKQLAEEAEAQGFQSGYEQGMLQAEAEYQQKQLQMQELLETAYVERKKIIQDSEPFLLSLSAKIAEKVIKGELTQHSEQLLNMVKQSLKQVEEKENVVIQTSPEDYKRLLPYLDEFKTYIGQNSEIKLIPVANFTKGGCIIQTAGGSYDVSVTSQLDEIKQQLLAYCEEKRNHDAGER
jgi:flagellar assembly protein FliH